MPFFPDLGSKNSSGSSSHVVSLSGSSVSRGSLRHQYVISFCGGVAGISAIHTSEAPLNSNPFSQRGKFRWPGMSRVPGTTLFTPQREECTPPCVPLPCVIRKMSLSHRPLQRNPSRFVERRVGDMLQPVGSLSPLELKWRACRLQKQIISHSCSDIIGLQCI